jgi:hypothetical protein
MVVNALRQWRLTCPKGELNLVFPNGAGRVESHTNILKRFWFPLQQACGITDSDGKARYPFHSLRHTAASLFIAHLSWTPKRVQAVLLTRPRWPVTTREFGNGQQQLPVHRGSVVETGRNDRLGLFERCGIVGGQACELAP